MTSAGRLEELSADVTGFAKGDFVIAPFVRSDVSRAAGAGGLP